VFIGHFALAFAARPSVPAISLGTLFIAVQLADLLWPLLVLAGVERFEIRPGITAVTPLDFIHYPWSHSLVTLTAWGAALAAALWLAGKARGREATIVVLLVVSHWLLDVITHRPDMPWLPGSEARVGLGLWNSVAGTLMVEGALFAAAIAFYARRTRARDATGRWALWGLVAFLTAIYVANLFGPPPPSVAAVAWAATAMWLLVAWAYWIDRHRETEPK